MRTAWGSTRERRHAGWREEAVWFPWAFGSDRIRGDSIDSSSSARATLLGEGLPVSLVVEFDEDRRAGRVRGERYRAAEGGQAVLSPWSGSCTDYRDFSGLQVPSQVEVSWISTRGSSATHASG